VLQFLVTSKVRRRLLVLLWGEKQVGSVAELAALADVSFSSAHTELKEMQRLDLVRTEREGAKEVFSANPAHPDADLLSRLVVADRPRRSPVSARDEQLKEKLVFLGAPLRGVRSSEVADADIVPVLVEGAQLARRDAVVARCLPVCFWNQRDHFDGSALRNVDAAPETKHVVAFFLELAGQLGGDRRLVGLAESMRDNRLTQERPFFYAMKPGSARELPAAKHWGFSINIELDSFRSLFDKFVTT